MSRVTVSGAEFVCSVDMHHVTRERRLDRDATGLQVSNLSDHDDVRILTQERLQRCGEGEPISVRTSTWLTP